MRKNNRWSPCSFRRPSPRAADWLPRSLFLRLSPMAKVISFSRYDFSSFSVSFLSLSSLFLSFFPLTEDPPWVSYTLHDGVFLVLAKRAIHLQVLFGRFLPSKERNPLFFVRFSVGVFTWVISLTHRIFILGRVINMGKIMNDERFHLSRSYLFLYWFL